MFANGSTFVAAFQAGRIPAGGATAIGWATSTDGGTSWSRGFLPGLTKGEGSGPYDAASDPAVAYDAKHGIWMIATLPLSSTLATPAVAVSRSSDGLTWENPVSADPSGSNSDKNWIACDSWASSPHYGNCYLEWDDSLNHDKILMSTSTDGGLSWGVAMPTANLAQGIGGQPLVQPNGTVVVPVETVVGQTETAFISAFSSSDGGLNWAAPVTISNVQSHAVDGQSTLPGSEAPLTSRPCIHFKELGRALVAVPPAHQLPGIGERLKYPLRRGVDVNFADDCVLIEGNDSFCHSWLLD